MALQEVRLTRHQIILQEGDFDAMKALYGRQATAMVRALVREHVRRIVEPKLKEAQES